MNTTENIRTAREVLKKVLEGPCDFYREKYTREHVDAFAIAEGVGHWDSLPFLTRSDIQRVPFWNRLFTSADEIDLIRVTSGTSGMGILPVPRTQRYPRGEIFDKSYLKRKNFKRAATFSGAQCLYAGMFRDLLGIDLLQLDPGNTPVSNALLAEYMPEVILGFPYTITAMLPHLSQRVIDSIKMVILFGEYCSPSQLQLMRKAFYGAEVVSEYASVESQTTLAGPCPRIIREKKWWVHPYPRYALFELVHLDSGVTITEEGILGELIVTVLRPTVFPLIRYKTGDSARIVKRMCDCEIGSPAFSIDGRIHIDRLRIPRGELHAGEIDRTLSTLNKSFACDSLTLRYAESLQGGKVLLPKVTAMLWWDDSKIDSHRLASLIAETLYVNPSMTYADGVKKGFYLPLSVEKTEKQEGTKKRVRIIKDSV